MGPRKHNKSEPSSSSESTSGRPDSDYLAKRARNNEAVKRSREKAREKANETTSKVTNLKNENEKLEEKVKLLSKELDFLKNIFLAHAGNAHNLCLDDLDIQALLKDEESADQCMSNESKNNSFYLNGGSSNYGDVGHQNY